MFRVILIIILFFTTTLSCFSQQIHYYSDNFYGGVTGGGYNPTFSQNTGTILLNIPSGSIIRKAFLFYSATKWSNQPNFPGELPLLINGTTVFLDTSYSLQNKFIESEGIPNSDADYVTLVKDISDLNSIQNQSVINIAPPHQIGFPVYWEYYILILYQNNTMQETALDIFINDQDCKAIINYTITPSNEIDLSKDVALALNTGAICDTVGDGSFVFVNSFPIGLIGGNEFNSPPVFCSSPSGNFYYENNVLHGLTDDTSDSLMIGSDVIANIKDYIVNAPIEVKFEYQSTQGPRTNVINQLFLTYTSPCDTFSTTLTPDTTICYGETLQLQATGGVSSGSNTGYEWTAISDSAAIDDLSCTDCPNPVFSGDKSQVYTVRIWNSDSCSVVKPVRIGVSQPEEIKTEMLRSICSFSTGKITVLDLPDKAVQLGAVTPNGDTISPSLEDVFSELAAGDYSVFYIDEFGCSVDTLITVEPIINTVAQFNAYPKKGTAPIQINLTNQSQNATDYSWWLNNEYQGNSFSGFYTDTSGVYEIELIAWRNDSICADTTSFTVIVFDSLVVTLPNVFTPNNDGVNDYFNIETNLPVAYELSILNRWGNVLFENKGKLTKGTHNLWNGKNKSGEPVTDGTYFYMISFLLDEDDVNCEVTDCEVRKNGFVQVFGK